MVFSNIFKNSELICQEVVDGETKIRFIDTETSESQLNSALSSKREYDFAMLALRIFNKNFYNLKLNLPFSNIFLPSTLITRKTK